MNSCLRKSSYIISIPSQNEPDKFIYVHGYTGGVDILDFSLVEAIENNKLDTLNDEEREFLVERGYLTTMTQEEEMYYVSNLVEQIYTYYQKQLTVLIAPNLDCSFRCTYCFQRDLQNKITKQPQSGLAKIMDKSQVDKIYRVLDDKIQDPNCKLNREITLYGGEALQVSNMEIINYIVSEGNKKGFYFNAISNGYEIEHFYHLFGNSGLKRIQITLDGFEQIHNKMRVQRDGKSSFHTIVQNIKNGLDKGCIFDLAFNFNEQNAKDISNLIAFFKEKEWLHHPEVVIHGNQIFDLKTNLTAFQENYGEIVELRKLASECNIMLSNSTTKIKALFESKLANNLPLPLKPSYCSANTGMYIFAPDNHLYACWEAVGDSIAKVGTYFPTFEVENKMMNRWKTRVTSGIDECHKCEYIMFCGGGCTINAYRKNGRFLSPYCDSFQDKFSDLMNIIIKN